jgi:hypothetical protein
MRVMRSSGDSLYAIRFDVSEEHPATMMHKPMAEK